MTVAEDHAGGQFVNIGPEEFRPALSVAEDSSACAPAACQTSDVRLETEVSELFSSPSSSPTPPPPVLSSPCSPLSHPTFPLSSRASSPPEVVDSIEERWPDLLGSDDEVDAPVGGETVFAAQQPPAGALFVAGAINGHLCPLLVDTGSAVTLMSEWFATVEMGLDPDSFTVDSPHLALSGPSGEQLTVVGSFVAHLVIGSPECRHRVSVVRGLQYDCLVGPDLLSTIPCSIVSDGNGQLTFVSTPTRVSTIQPVGADILVKQSVQIPPRSQQIVMGRIRRKGGSDHLPAVALVSPAFSSNHLLGEKFFVANSVVSPADDLVPVCLLNSSDRTVKVPRKTKIASLSAAAVLEESVEEQVPGTAEHDLWSQLHVGTEELSDAQVDAVRQLVNRNSDIFAQAGELGRTSVMEMEIDTGQHAPIRHLPRRMAPHQREEVASHVQQLLQQGVIEPSSSPWSSPVVLARKQDGSTRMCIDFRRLNAATRRDAFPLPRVDDTLDALGGAKFFSTLDLCAGYHQIPVAERDRPKTAFSTTDGHFQFTSMPFGVCNGPSQFQRLMTLVLAGLQWSTCLIYLDDVIVFGKTFEEHQARLQQVFERLRSAGLKLKPSKCFLFCSSVAFLGHVICADGVLTDPEKVRVVRDWPCPTSVSAVRAFLLVFAATTDALLRISHTEPAHCTTCCGSRLFFVGRKHAKHHLPTCVTPWCLLPS